MTTSTGPVPQLAWDQALAWRMQRHHLLQRAEPPDLLHVVSDICGLHAQLMSSAELSLWARVDGLPTDALAEALWQQRTLIKLWAIRGTLHLLPAHEIGLWLAAIGTHTRDGNAGYPGLDELTDAVTRALEGQVLSREDLALAGREDLRLLRARGVGPLQLGLVSERPRTAVSSGFAPSVGNSVRFTAPASWIPHPSTRSTPTKPCARSPAAS